MMGWKPIGVIAAEIVADLRFGRAVERLHAKGPRAVGELLAELGAERSITTIIETKLDRFAAIDDEVLQVMGRRSDAGESDPQGEVMTDKTSRSPTDCSNSLTVLAGEINNAHQDAIGAFRTGLDYAIKCGKALIDAKALVPHGQWAG